MMEMTASDRYALLYHTSVIASNTVVRTRLRLLYHDTVIISETCVQQGDPVGSLLYSISFRPILVKLLLKALWIYASVIKMILYCLEWHAVAMVLIISNEEAANIDLPLKLSKCKLITSSIQKNDISWTIKLPTDACFEYLGASIGSPEFSNTYRESKVDKLIPLLAIIAKLDSPNNLLSIKELLLICKDGVFCMRNTLWLAC